MRNYLDQTKNFNVQNYEFRGCELINLISNYIFLGDK